MRALMDISSDYRETISLLRDVPLRTDILCLISVSLILPGFFRHLVSESRRAGEDYHCYGSYCDPDRTFARMPWVVCRRRRSPAPLTGGYLVALLFREDMAGCWLSLNRGYAIYQEIQRGEDSLRCPSAVGTTVLVSLISGSTPWVVGTIDLAATVDFTRCHEAGAAISRYYDMADLPGEDEVARDFLQLLDWYDKLAEGDCQI